MNPAILCDVVCPAQLDGNPCQARLNLAEDFPPTTASGHPDEILEALLLCPKCAKRYPILCGVLILLDPLGPYLRRSYAQIDKVTAAHRSFSQPMRRFLFEEMLKAMERPGRPLFKAWDYAPNERDRQTISASIHYSYNLSNGDSRDTPRTLAEHLSQTSTNPQKESLGFLAQPNRPTDGKALEVGCDVGGFVHELARSQRFVYGIDLSFERISVARQIVKGLPRPKTTYSYYQEVDVTTERALQVEPRSNTEFLVATAESLPFLDDSFLIVSSFHVSELICRPFTFFREKIRVLRPSGLFLYASVDIFKQDARPEEWAWDDPVKRPLEALKSHLSTALKILHEEDGVPWIKRYTHRSFEVYFSHCLWAEKRPSFQCTEKGMRR